LTKRAGGGQNRSMEQKSGADESGFALKLV